MKLPPAPRGGEDSRMADLAPLLADGLSAKAREESDHNLGTRSCVCKGGAQGLGRAGRDLGSKER